MRAARHAGIVQAINATQPRIAEMLTSTNESRGEMPNRKLSITREDTRVISTPAARPNAAIATNSQTVSGTYEGRTIEAIRIGRATAAVKMRVFINSGYDGDRFEPVSDGVAFGLPRLTGRHQDRSRK